MEQLGQPLLVQEECHLIEKQEWSMESENKSALNLFQILVVIGPDYCTDRETPSHNSLFAPPPSSGLLG